MRKVAIAILTVALSIGLAGPASAAKPTRTLSSSSTAQAFWYTFEQLNKTTTRNSVWYVGVYIDSGFSYSDLYREEDTCRTSRRHTICSSTFSFGDIDLSSGTFTMDSTFSTAHLEATYQLQESDQLGNPIGGPVSTSVVTDWTGVGDLQTNGGKSSYCDQFICTRSTFTDDFRQAEANGSINSVDLGETYDAFMAGDTTTTIERLK
jgi:hypothetical protein